MTVQFALLGAGRIGKVHAKAVAGHDDAKLVAVYDPMAGAAEFVASQYDARLMQPDEIAQNSDIDAVLICTPTNTHADFIEKFARAGKAVFCEKPIDLSLDRVRACLQVVKDCDGRLMIGFNRRFDPQFMALRSEIAAGHLGEVEQVIITSRDPSAPPSEYIKSSGGIFRDMTIHDFDMARFLLGEEVKSIFARGSVLTDPKIAKLGDFDSAMVLMTTETGKQCVINNSRRATYGYDQRAEVHGSLGMARVHNPRPVLVELAGEGGYRRAPLQDFFMTRYEEAYANEIGILVDAVHAGRSLEPTGQDGLIALAMAEAAMISAQENRVVELAEVL